MSDAAPNSIYSAPPIIEALVQFVYADPVSTSVYRKLIKRLGRNYTHSTATENVNANLDFVARKADFVGEPQQRLSSDDQTDILLIQPNALTWSRLAPYPGWITFAARIRRDTEAALTVSQHRKMLRMGVRYINRLDVPVVNNVIRYEDYLAINIALPAEIPLVDSYAWRIERSLPEKNVRAIIQSAIVAPEIPNTGAFLLDIDIFSMHELPAKVDDVFKKLEEMRVVKNEHFELSIRQKARVTFSS